MPLQGFFYLRIALLATVLNKDKEKVFSKPYLRRVKFRKNKIKNLRAMARSIETAGFIMPMVDFAPNPFPKFLVKLRL